MRSDIVASSGALVRFAESNQLLKTSSITLKTKARLQALSDFDTTNTFKNLSIEGGGIVHFNHVEGNSLNSKYYIKIDNLIINQDGHLELHDWQAGRDHLLVRKDSKYLEDALKKISIEGWGQNQVYLKDYDEEYWSIEAAPEPSAYGAILGVIGIGLWSWRKRRRPQKPNRDLATPALKRHRSAL